MRNIIKTERLVLRPIAVSDAKAFSTLAGDFEISKMTGSIPHPFPVITAEVKLMMMLSQKRRHLAFPYAVTKNGDDMIGIVDVFRRSYDHDWEVGYWIGRPYWGKGYAPEAMLALMDEVRQSEGTYKFVAGTWEDNPASGRVLEKLGFRRTGPEGTHFAMARLKNLPSMGFEKTYTAPLPATDEAAIHAA